MIEYARPQPLISAILHSVNKSAVVDAIAENITNQTLNIKYI